MEIGLAGRIDRDERALRFMRRELEVNEGYWGYEVLTLTKQEADSLFSPFIPAGMIPVGDDDLQVDPADWVQEPAEAAQASEFVLETRAPGRSQASRPSWRAVPLHQRWSGYCAGLCAEAFLRTRGSWYPSYLWAK